MDRRHVLPVMCGACLLAAFPVASVGQTPEEEIVRASVSVLDQIMAAPAQRIPTALLSSAHGVAIIPNVIKGGFVVGLRHGKGVVLVRDDQGNWRAPVFMTLTAGSVGFQAGVQSTDVILVFKTKQSVAGLMNGKLTIGVDAAGAAGPVGRQASAATDARLAAEILSYSRSRGLFAGVSFDGAGLQVDHLATANYYRQQGNGWGQPGAQQGAVPESTITLVNRLNAYAKPLAPAPGNPQAVAPTAATIPQDRQAAANDGWIPQAPAGVVAPTPEATRAKLANAWTELSTMVDGQWKDFLALPPETFAVGQAPNLDAVKQSIQNFTTVAKDPRYVDLIQRPEFQTTYRLLLDYFEIYARPLRSALVLPPPPR